MGSASADGEYTERARVFKALADPHRLRILDMLSAEGSLNGKELAERLGISLALLSHHWKILTEAGLITKEQRGQTKYCTLECARITEALRPWPAPPPPVVVASDVTPRAKKTTGSTAGKKPRPPKKSAKKRAG